MKILNNQKLRLGLIIVVGLGLLTIMVVFLWPKKEVIDIQMTKNECRKDGCSGQLCVDVTKDSIRTTCEWKEVYGCYRSAKCEKQPSGKCGFTPSKELDDCVNKNL